MTDVEKAPAATVVDPRSGEVLDLAAVDHRELVAIFSAALDYERQVQSWRRAAEDELVRRHGDRRAPQVVGDVEVDVNRGFARVWDPIDTEATLVRLVGEGKLSDAQAREVLLYPSEPKIDGRQA